MATKSRPGCGTLDVRILEHKSNEFIVVAHVPDAIFGREADIGVRLAVLLVDS